MTEFRDILNRDTDESIAWARQLASGLSEAAAQHFLSVLADPEQTLLRRLNAAAVVNALASSRALPETIATQAAGALPGLLKDEDSTIRRNALVAVSSVFHSSARTVPEGRLELLRHILEDCVPMASDDWDRSKLTSIRSALSAPGVRGRRLELFDSIPESVSYSPPMITLRAASLDRLPEGIVLSNAVAAETS